MGNDEETNRVRRILSLDGGGLYGLTSALWLRQLCEQDEKFLSEGDVDLLAGCSAGALNALLLARETNPRKFVLAGGLEEFWRQPGTFSNSNPFTAFWSLFQVTAWFGAEDLLRLLRDEFGDMTLGDLPNGVLITSFNWTGRPYPWEAPPHPPAGCPPGTDPCNPWAAFGAPGAGLSGSGAVSSRGWRPKFFKNFPHDELDRRCRIVDVAYAATTPPGLRAVLNGFGDGGAFNACPCADAIAAAVAEERHEDRKPTDFRPVQNVLKNLRMLSLGVGAKRASYWLSFFDLSILQFGWLPTNPPVGNWYPQGVSVGLDGPTEEAVYIAEQLLASRFHRLNPSLLEMPTMVAVLWSRFPLVRESLTQQIYAAVETRDSKLAVGRALEFLDHGWHDRHEWTGDDEAPPAGVSATT
jgi:patatin-like phospholipase